MHYYAFLAYLIVMTFSSVINHLNIEIYPKWFRESKLGPWFIGASHHTVHHTEFRKNYGLYFTFWDRWLGTEKSEK